MFGHRFPPRRFNAGSRIFQSSTFSEFTVREQRNEDTPPHPIRSIASRFPIIRDKRVFRRILTRWTRVETCRMQSIPLESFFCSLSADPRETPTGLCCGNSVAPVADRYAENWDLLRHSPEYEGKHWDLLEVSGRPLVSNPGPSALRDVSGVSAGLRIAFRAR